MDVKYPYLPAGKKISYTDLDNRFMQAAKEICDNSSCVKHPTGAVVVKDDIIIGRGSNAGKLVDVCPRWHSPTGTNYHHCKTTCLQAGHSEVTSIQDARKNNHDTAGADLYLYGHWWCCKNCWDTIEKAGIKNVFLLEDSWNLFNRDQNKKMQSWGNPKESYILRLEKKALSDDGIRRDIDFLINLIDNGGRSKKRWEIFLEKDESLSSDGDVCDHSIIMENLAYELSRDESLDEGSTDLLVWAAKFHDLGELRFGDKTFNLKDEEDSRNEADYIENEIMAGLKTEYAKNRLKAAIGISLRKEKPSGATFDLAGYFNALERIGYLETSMQMAANKPIKNWQVLMSNVLYNQLVPLISSTRRFKSIKNYLDNHINLLNDMVNNLFTRESAIQSLFLAYNTDDLHFLNNEKNKDTSQRYIDQIKDNWIDFAHNL